MLMMCSQEAITATITLNDDDQATVRRMLTYLYTLDYDDQDISDAVAVSKSQDSEGHLAGSSPNSEVVDDATAVHCKRMNNVLVYALAEKYNIPALKELAATKFVGCEGPFDFARYQELINAICESTPGMDTGLRKVVILDCVNPQFIKKVLEEEGLAPAIRDHGSLGLGMLREVVKKLENLNSELEMKEMKEQEAKAREKDLVVELKGSNAKIQRLKAEQEMMGRGAQAREIDLEMALAGSNAKIQHLKAEQETKERDAVARAIELKVTLGWLYQDAKNVHIPEKEDSLGAFERSGQALGLFQEKIRALKDSVSA